MPSGRGDLKHKVAEGFEEKPLLSKRLLQDS